MQVTDLPALNAGLNFVSTLLLLTGWVCIRRKQEYAHRAAMMAAFVVSCAFLTSYLIYHYHAGHVRFGGPSPFKQFYLFILISHIILAAAAPVLAIVSIVLGLKNARRAHRAVSRYTFPIWMYVSVTGVVIYVMLYKIWPPHSPLS